MDAFIYNEIWACRPACVELLAAELDGISAKALRAGAPKSDPPDNGETRRGIAILQIMGLILHRRSFLSDYLGATTLDVLGAQVRKAIADESISHIVFVIDSPGGMTTGVPELSRLIYDARQQKKTFAFVYGATLASAAYWIAAGCEEIVSTPSATAIGSIGVMRMHRSDDSQEVTILRSTGASQKSRPNPFEPLTDDLKAREIQRLDSIQNMFDEDVARGRGVSVDIVREHYGKGAEFISDQALERGMVDSLQSFDDFLARWDLRPNSEGVEIEILPTKGT